MYSNGEHLRYVQPESVRLPEQPNAYNMLFLSRSYINLAWLAETVKIRSFACQISDLYWDNIRRARYKQLPDLSKKLSQPGLEDHVCMNV